jgi:hypothetical protein
MITAYTHDEHCDMFLNIGVSNNEALTGARKFVLDYPGRHHSDTRFFRRLEHRLLKTGNIVSMALVNVGHGHQPMKML